MNQKTTGDAEHTNRVITYRGGIKGINHTHTHTHTHTPRARTRTHTEHTNHVITS